MNEMREQPEDDTTKAPESARHEGIRERGPGRYYEDDGTGYEVYDPSEEEADAESGEDAREEKD